MLRRFLLFSLMLFLVVALLPFSLAQADCDFSDSNYARAVQLHDMGDYDRALRHYHCARLESPDDAIIPILIDLVHDDIANAASAWARPAEDLLRALLGEDARNLLKADDLKSLNLTSPDPGDTGEYRRGDSPRVDFRRVTETSGDEGTLYSLERAQEREPARVDLRCELGRLYMTRGDYAAAYGQFTPLIVERLGDHCDGLEQPKATGDAAPAATDAITAAPAPVSPAEAQFTEGLSAMNDGKRYLAANIFLAALELDPLHLDARCRLGMIYAEWAHYRGALEQFDIVLGHEPDNRCAQQNRTIAARDMLAIFTPLVVDDYFHYARIYIGMAEWELARDAFLEGLAIDPTRMDVRCELGALYAQLGDDLAALREFDLALFADDMDSCARSNRYALLQRLRDG